MKAFVPQFQEELAFGEKKAEELLRMAQLISSKLGLTDILQWIEYELNGYPNVESVPDYRTAVSTELQYYNPYRGWCNAVGNRAFELEPRVRRAEDPWREYVLQRAGKKQCKTHDVQY